MKFVGAVLIWGVLAGAAMAAPGQCSVTGFAPFDCDVVLDGDGLTFALTDGQVLAFAASDVGKGMVYLAPADAMPGQPPVALGAFSAKPNAPGCWANGRDDFEFCALVAQ